MLCFLIGGFHCLQGTFGCGVSWEFGQISYMTNIWDTVPKDVILSLGSDWCCPPLLSCVTVLFRDLKMGYLDGFVDM